MNSPTKPADTAHPILDCLANRWSPRAFDPRPVEPDKLVQLFEAARWAASAFNEQPWRFIVATHSPTGDDRAAYDKLLSCLVEANQSWAKAAPVLIITCTRERFAKNDKPNRCAQHDLGLAVGNLAAQATALGLALHQMAGIDADHAQTTLAIPAPFQPFSAIALGYPSNSASLPEAWMRDAEAAERTRNPLADVVFTNAFGQPSPLFS